MNHLKTISPGRAAEIMRNGAVLVDIREADEHAREHIPGARHHALSRIDKETPLRQGDGLIFAVHHRPVRGTRGSYRVTMRHGVSQLRSGQRHTLGVIFYDAA